MKKLTLLLIAVLIFTLLAGCSSPSVAAAQPAPTPAKAKASDDISISASAEVVPAKMATLGMPAAGIVAEVLVADGENVTTGQVLVRLGGQEDAQARVSSSKYALAEAQKALDTLKENALVSAAQAQKAVADAKKALEDASKKVESLTFARASDTLIDNTQSKIDLAKKQVALAADFYRRVQNKPDGDTLKAQAQLNLTNAQMNLDNLISQYNWYTGRSSEIESEQIRANLALAEAQLANAQREYTVMKNGPDPAELKVAEALVANAEAQLAAAESALAGLELHAPFDGVISSPLVNAGEYIVFGQPVMQLADLSTLLVKTTDLNETDVAKIQPGDFANVTFDALSGVNITGNVLSIAPKSSAGSGVNYAVTIKLDDFPKGLRWGMTAFVVIKTKGK